METFFAWRSFQTAPIKQIDFTKSHSLCNRILYGPIVRIFIPTPPQKLHIKISKNTLHEEKVTMKLSMTSEQELEMKTSIPDNKKILLRREWDLVKSVCLIGLTWELRQVKNDKNISVYEFWITKSLL